MTPEVDPGFWKWLATISWIPVSGLFGLVWANLVGRIKHVERASEGSASKEDLNRMRESIRDLYAKIEANKDLVNQKIGDAQRFVSQDMDRLRGDMNGGFERIYKTIMEQRKG